jgi:PAS domain S-box-containing protein
MPPAACVPGATILVVDDFDDGRALTSTFLRHVGYSVIEAATGAQALAAASRRPDLVVLDVNLPDIDGFEVCRRIKSDPATASTPVLHLSAAYREVGDRVRGLEGGADGYLTLPVTSDELIANVNSLLRIHRAEAELRRSQERYRRLVDTALEGVWTVDETATTTYVNAQMATMLGLGVDDIVGRPLWAFVDAEARTDVEGRFERAREGRRERFDLRWRRADGGDLWAIVAIQPLGDDERFAGVLLLVTDVTDRQRAEKAEQEAAMLRSVATLAAAAGHEINNPLMAVMGNLELLARIDTLDDRAQRCVQRGLEAARSIRDKVRHMAKITRLELAEGPKGLPPMLDLRRSSPVMKDERS